MRKKYIVALIIPYFIMRIIFAEGIDKADVYNKNSELQWNWANDAIKKHDWKGGERVLDVGCGDGKITALIASKVEQGSIIGLDISNEMIDFASSFFQRDNLSFIQGNVLKLPFKDQFDLIVSFNALHWVVDQKTALLSMKDSLVQGGKALIVIPAYSSNNISTRCEELINHEKWKPYFSNFKQFKIYFDQLQYDNLLKEVGFEVIDIKTIYNESMFSNLESFEYFFRPLLPFIDHLSEELQKDFITELIGLMSYKVSVDGSIYFPYFRLEVLVEK
jgi:trans-aconitate 2-methyltransferase